MNNFEAQFCDENVADSRAEIRAHRRVNRRVVSRRDSRLSWRRNSRKERKGRGGEEKEEELREEGTVEGNSAPRLKPPPPPDAEDTLEGNVYFETRSRFLHELAPPALITPAKVSENRSTISWKFSMLPPPPLYYVSHARNSPISDCFRLLRMGSLSVNTS